MGSYNWKELDCIVDEEEPLALRCLSGGGEGGGRAGGATSWEMGAGSWVLGAGCRFLEVP